MQVERAFLYGGHFDDKALQAGIVNWDLGFWHLVWSLAWVWQLEKGIAFRIKFYVGIIHVFRFKMAS